jgi:hypothetical protein
MPHGMAVTHQRQRLKIGHAAFLLMPRRCSDPLCVMTLITGWRLFLTARVAVGLVSMSARLKRSVGVTALLPVTASGPWCPSASAKASAMVEFSF